MDLLKSVKKLCPPALVYLVLSVIGFFLVLGQNIGNTNSYNIGHYSMRCPSTIMVFVFKVLYILFWTWVLNILCKSGFSGFSWFLVLLPFILMFIILAMVMFNK
jgi:hypothetical protein